MKTTRVIPVLLIQSDGLVKTVRFRDAKYVGDPINAVKIFNEKEVDEIVVLDISATVSNHSPNFKLITSIAGECFMPFAYGGGVRSMDHLAQIFRLGAEKVVLNSITIEDAFFVKKASEMYGSQSIVVSMDVKKTLFGKYRVKAYGGKKDVDVDPVSHAIQMQEMGAGEIFLNSIDRDGTMEGYDIDIINKISTSVDVPVIACGGAGTIQHFCDAIKYGQASAVAAGSMFVFQGKHRAVLISYPSANELLTICESN